MPRHLAGPVERDYGPWLHFLLSPLPAGPRTARSFTTSTDTGTDCRCRSHKVSTGPWPRSRFSRRSPRPP